MPDGPLAKGDGETWEAYAHRLEQRIKAQRDHIRSISELRDKPGDKKARARIELLERSLGRMTARFYRERESREAVTGQLSPLRDLEASVRHALNAPTFEAHADELHHRLTRLDEVRHA